jgi:DNA-binding MarR family transcriptional regulator
VELSKIGSSPRKGEALARQTDEIRDRLSAALRMVDEIATVPQSRALNATATEKEIREILKLRRRRARFFDADLFADPAWDMLLELYAAELGQQRISISSLARGAAVPMTTALRWITTLETSGLIERQPDPLDGRRYFMSLSYRGLEAMDTYFRTVPDGAPLI